MKKKVKSKKRDYIEKYVEQQLSKFRDQFEKESDRAKVILSAAMLETALENLLKAQLAPSASSEDSLLEGAYAPISTFSAKIDLAHRLGLISTKFAKDLHLIRRIRNDFAHNVQSCDFEEVAVHSRCTELARSSGMGKRDPTLRKLFEEGPRGDFLMTVAWMLYHLWNLVSDLETFEVAEPEWAYEGK